MSNKMLFNFEQIKLSDPTKTLTLRNAFVAEMTRRFNKLKRLINQKILDEDVFNFTLRVYESVELRNNFIFKTTAQKIDDFRTWLEEQENSLLLAEGWTNPYIKRGYNKGTQRAQIELKKLGIEGTGFNLWGRVSDEKLQLLYTRTFTELRDITTAMDQQISRVLADGLLEGRGAKEIARAIVDRVDAIGKTRATTLARTEIVRAHNQGNLEQLKQAGVEGIMIQAEWSTAGDNRVCSICGPLEGNVYNIDKVPSIPHHPNCRCVALPYIEGYK